MKIFYKTYTNLINKSFCKGEPIEQIGEGILAPLQKPNKEKGPITNLRPMILLNGTRKILSLIALKRIEQEN